jgi:glucose-1-phosphate cytidylyltransferase
MKVVILCGGKGTRLREETEYRPKPMVPIGNRPILWHIMKIYAACGFTDFVLCLGYKGDMIKDFFRNYLWMTSQVTLRLGHKANVKFHNHHPEEDWTVTLADTGEDTLTAGRIRRVKQFIGDDPEFFLTYGDGVGNIDIGAALEFHRKHGKKLTVTAVRPPGRFGELSLGQQGQVIAFNEKPQTEAGRINGGFFVASRSVFDYLGEDADQTMFEQEPVQTIAREGQLMAFPHDGFWQPMDTFSEYSLLNRLWAEGKAPWKTWKS